jgi:hypothetical protein
MTKQTSHPFDVCAGAGDADRFELIVALVAVRVVVGPGTEVFCRWKYEHIGADFRKNRNSGHRIEG